MDEKDAVINAESAAANEEIENAVKEGEPAAPEENAKEEKEEDAVAKENAVTDGEPAAPKKMTANERIRQLAEERAYWKGQAEALQKQPATQVEKSNPPQKPAPDKFTSYEEYTEALTDWKVDQKLRQAEAERERASSQKVFEERVSKAAEKYPDFRAVAFNPSVAISAVMLEAIKESDLGADIAYYLGSNAEEAARIARLNPISAIKEIGQIEARIRAPKAEPRRITQAPKPVKTVTGSGEAVDKDPSMMSMDEYIAFRKKKTG